MGNRAAVVVVFLFECLLGCLGLYAQSVTGGVAPETLNGMETAEARQSLRDTVLEGPVGRLGSLRLAPVYQRIYGSTVTVATRARVGAVDIVLAVAGGGGRGEFTLTRDTRDGEALEFRIRTRDDPDSYLVARPMGDRTTIDVYHLSSVEPLYRGVIVPVPFRDLVVSPLERIVSLTGMKIDWPFLLYPGSRPDDQRVEQLATDIRSRLGGLRDADDGAIDEDGRYVSIATLAPQAAPGGLNCSGFAKWVVDGYYYPLTGRNTTVADAKHVDDEERGNSFSDALYYMDPYFGLDWTRNLAVLLDDARARAASRGVVRSARGDDARPQDFDVRSIERMVYTEDLGYEVTDLPLALYTLAVRDPGNFYLASVNGVIDEDTGLRQYYHVLVLLPYFDASGRFRAAVFERVRETDLSSVVRRYQGHQIHLVRVGAGGVFAPLALP